jgi:hypothetical protein
MSTRKELELRVEELLASEAQLIRRIRELESIIAGTEYEELPEPADQRSAFVEHHNALHRIYAQAKEK